MGERYIDYLMQNRELDTESDESSDDDGFFLVQEGGLGNQNDIPNGGFLPIYICKEYDVITESDKKKPTREFVTHKNAVSIKDILEKRRTHTPFL